VIIVGQYVGFVIILAVSLAAATGLLIVPDRWVGLLGLVPIGFGVHGLWRLRGTNRTSWPQLGASMLRVAAVTLANGADNISVFTPLFRTAHVAGSLWAAGLFLVLIALLCGMGALLGGHPVVAAKLGRISPWLVPTVFIAVGLFILITSGTLVAIRHAL
jgi:cadmium resistance protein CadD (predicted permease)